MYVVQVFPTVEFTNSHFAFSTVAVKTEVLVLEMSLKENQTHPAEKSPGTLVFQFLGHSLSPSCKNFADGLFEFVPHCAVAFRATRNLELPIPESSSVRECDGSVVQLVAPENPFWKDMLIVEWDGVRFCATNEAIISLRDVRDESRKAEEENAPFAVQYGIVGRNVQHGRRGRVPTAHQKITSSERAGQSKHGGSLASGKH
jgi:hypothetical protein